VTFEIVLYSKVFYYNGGGGEDHERQLILFFTYFGGRNVKKVWKRWVRTCVCMWGGFGTRTRLVTHPGTSDTG